MPRAKIRGEIPANVAEIEFDISSLLIMHGA